MIFHSTKWMRAGWMAVAMIFAATVGSVPAGADDQPAEAKASAAAPASPSSAAGEAEAGSTGSAGASGGEAEKSAAHHDAGHDAGHGGGHGHDPLDLSEGNGSDALPKPDDIRFDLAIYTAVVFFLLLAILGKFAWGPICHALEEREHRIEAMIKQAEENAEKSAASLREYEVKLATAADEARELITKARKDADALREQILAEAQAAAQRERDRAVADIASAKDVALQEIAQRSVDTAVTLASQIVRRELRATDHQGIVREVLDQLPSQN